MKLKQLLTFALAGTLMAGSIFSASAAELDFAWYAKQNPDVVAEVGDSPEALKLHYDMYGRKEARMANTKDVEAQLRRLFNVDEYATLYPDVKEFYGEDAEAMFMHYLSYGLLEARRPSEKVSQAVASSLKKAVEKALTDAGVEATPGSLELVAVITGETETLVAAKPELAVDTAELEKVTAALEQVTTVVEKAVVETVAEVTNPAPQQSSGGGGGGGGDSRQPQEYLDPTASGNLYAQDANGSGPFKLLKGGYRNELTDEKNGYFTVSQDSSGNTTVTANSKWKIFGSPTSVTSVTNGNVGDSVTYNSIIKVKQRIYSCVSRGDGVTTDDVTMNDQNKVAWSGGKTYYDVTGDEIDLTKYASVSSQAELGGFVNTVSGLLVSAGDVSANVTENDKIADYFKIVPKDGSTSHEYEIKTVSDGAVVYTLTKNGDDEYVSGNNDVAGSLEQYIGMTITYSVEVTSNEVVKYEFEEVVSSNSSGSNKADEYVAVSGGSVTVSGGEGKLYTRSENGSKAKYTKFSGTVGDYFEEDATFGVVGSIYLYSRSEDNGGYSAINMSDPVEVKKYFSWADGEIKTNTDNVAYQLSGFTEINESNLFNKYVKIEKR